MTKAERVLVFAPMSSEMRPVAKLLHLERTGEQGGIPVYTGDCGDAEVVLTGTGIGPELANGAAERMLAGSAFDRVIVSGIAGGLAPASLVGDLVVPEEVYDGATGDRFRSTPIEGVTPKGVIRMGDGDSYELNDAEVARLVDEGVTAVDMETAAIARVCARHDVPWIAFRVISDMAGEAALDAGVLALVDELGNPKPWPSVKYLFTHPRQIPLMLRVGRDASAAARAAAKAAVAAISPRGAPPQ
ncbi:MAG: adenosylhomocysteine nucleosidase [Acidimicrobiaceae bacterium]|jgi:nucleoside phosphorylase